MSLFRPSTSQQHLDVIRAYEGLMALSNQESPVDHREFLSLVVRVLRHPDSDRRVFACLWLKDWKQGRYLLDLFDCGGAADEKAGDLAQDLGGVVVEVPSEAASTPVSPEVASLLSGHPKVSQIVDRLACSSCVEHVGLNDGGNPQQIQSASTTTRHIGVLQVWSSRPFQSWEQPLLANIGRALATNLHRHRSRREFVALKRLHNASGTDRSKVESWYRTAAEATGEATSADFCLVMEPAPHRRLHGTVAWSRKGGFDPNPSRFVAGNQSVIRRIFELHHETVRLGNWNDAAERSRRIGTSAYDVELEAEIRKWVGTQNTWMACPLVARGQVLAVVLLLNKSRNLPLQFSATDQEILESVCRYLADVLPAIVARDMIEGATGGESSAVHWLGSDERDAKPAGDRLLETLRKSIPSIEGATLWIAEKERPSEASLKHLGRPSLFETHPELLREPTQGVVTLGTPPDEEYYQVIRISGDLTGLAHLGVVLLSPSLSDYEEELLRLFVRVFVYHALKARQLFDTEVRVFVEMRHNIRAGLHGLSHLSVALNILEFLKDRGFPPVSALLQKALKSIRRANLFAETSRLLLEHSRLLHTGLTRDDLAPRKISVGSVVRQVNLALQPEMDRYRVAVNLVDRIPPNEEVEADPQLIYILFFNLIENAIKYSVARRPVSVRIFFADRQWHGVVENTGRYLDPQSRIDIFRPFVRRYDSELRRARPGTGLGLPTVRLIVAAHGGGNVQVESVPTKVDAIDAECATNTFSFAIPRWIR